METTEQTQIVSPEVQEQIAASQEAKRLLEEKIEDQVRHIINNEILVCQSYLVEELLTKGVFEWDYVQNLYVFPEWSCSLLGEDLFFRGGTEKACEKFKEKFEDLRYESEVLLLAEEISELKHERNLELIQKAEEEFEQLETEAQEIFEWWAVTSYFAEKLVELGEPILENDYGTWWGRTCTGQAISMDYVIRRYAQDRIEQFS